MSKTSYTLLLINERDCSRCNSKANCILLGKENEFLGFYCWFHGADIQQRLEEKFQFQGELERVRFNKRKKKFKFKIEKEVLNKKEISIPQFVYCKQCRRKIFTKEKNRSFCNGTCLELWWNKTISPYKND